MKRLICILLCLCLTVCLLTGCHRDTTEDTGSAATAVPTTEATEPPPAPEALYADAAAELENVDDLRMEITVETERQVGTDTLRETTTRTAEYQSYGKKEMIAHVSDLIVSDVARASYELVYADRKVYATIKATKFYSGSDPEDFLSEQLPPVLLDAARYGSVTLSRTADGQVFAFEDASEAEDWAMPADAELLSASGTATADADGRITAQTYDVSFLFGGSTIHNVYSVAVERPEALDLSGLAPKNPKGYESLDSITAALILFRAYYSLQNAAVCSIERDQTFFAQAGGRLQMGTQTLHCFKDGDDYLYRRSEKGTNVDYVENEQNPYSYEEIYRDGTLSVSSVYGDETQEEKDREVKSAGVEADAMRLRMQFFPQYLDLIDASITDAGDYYLIEFSGTDDYGKNVKWDVGNYLFSSTYVLDGNATNYVTRTVEGSLAVEKCTYLPTSLNLSFDGVHTIQGEPCALQMVMNSSIKLYDPNTYMHITDEPLPDEAPEQKPTPVFYEVTAKNGHRMYLFGTIHIGDDRTAFLPQKIYDAFDSADALAVEFDDDAFEETLAQDEALQEMVAKSYYYTDGTTVSNHIDSDLYKAATVLMKVAGEYSELSDSLKAWVWGNVIDGFYLAQGRKFTSSKGVDNRLMERAREQEKQILNVESAQMQLELMSECSDEVQQLLLAQSVACSRNENLRNTYELYERWCRGDEAEIIEHLSYMTEEERDEIDADELAIYDEYHQKMELDRNAAMLEVAEGYLDGEQTVFYAVGLAHLLGDGGLVQALRDAGYTVTRIDTAQD